MNCDDDVKVQLFNRPFLEYCLKLRDRGMFKRVEAYLKIKALNIYYFMSHNDVEAGANLSDKE